MKPTVLFVSFFLCLLSYRAQEIKKTVDCKLLVNDLVKVEQFLSTYIQKHQVRTEKSTRSKEQLKITVWIEHHQVDSFMNHYKSWGLILTQDVSIDYEYDNKHKILFLEKQALIEERDAYSKLSSKTDSSQTSVYFVYQERIIGLNKQIAEQTRKIDALKQANTQSKISLTINEESKAASSYDYDWINMPGLEYSILFVENHANGFTSPIMQGVQLKYLFNSAKSYGVLGLYKSLETNTSVTDLYLLAYGQDFYSSKLGRGQRKYFNLHSSFNLGVYIANGESFRSQSWFFNPFLGLEIIKTEHILLDTKCGYFLPYKDNRNMRGLLFNLSFNFLL